MSIYFGSTTDGELISELAQRGYLAIPLELESVAFWLAEKELAQVRAEPTHWEVKQGGRVFVLNAQEFTGKSYDLASFKPLYAAPQPAAQEQTSAVPVVRQMVVALDLAAPYFTHNNQVTAAIVAGQKYLKENKHA